MAVAPADCELSIGNSYADEVTEAMRDGMEARGGEVIEIGFGRNTENPGFYTGEAVVRIEEGGEEIRANCRILLNEENTIVASDCAGAMAAMQTNSLERDITACYKTQDIEVLEIGTTGTTDGTLPGNAAKPFGNAGSGGCRLLQPDEG